MGVDRTTHATENRRAAAAAKALVLAAALHERSAFWRYAADALRALPPEAIAARCQISGAKSFRARLVVGVLSEERSCRRWRQKSSPQKPWPA